jgi:cytidylate kinase
VEESLRKIDLLPLGILTPDLTFLLEAPYKERMKRIALRENADISDVMNQNNQDEYYQSKVENEFLQDFNHQIIDTEGKSMEEILNVLVIKCEEKLRMEKG